MDRPLKPGDKVKLVGSEYGGMRPGDTGTFVEYQPGIFPSHPYAVVEYDGKTYAGYVWRWEKA